MEEKLLMCHRQQEKAATKAVKRSSHKAKTAASASRGKAAAAEYGCSCCLCCVSCPLSVIWCCFKLPCEAGIKAARSAKRQIMSTSGGGSCWSCGKKRYPSGPYYSSSFSDIDFPSPSS
ncbi:unnamed protein product [Linum trigynum]|uniref:Uncharacterized protein n=1 Tax=Linum trigynum TaxID=586398 RepID=A0AAV2G006_9ROSI